MCGIQAGAETRCHHCKGDSRLGSQSPVDRREDDKSRVTEYRDAHDIACQAHGERSMLLAYHIQNGIGHSQRSACLLQNSTDDGTGDDDDSDASQDGSESTGERADQHINLHASQNPDKIPRKQQYDEWMPLEFGNQENHSHDCDNDDQKQIPSCHVFFLLYVYLKTLLLKNKGRSKGVVIVH
ncbi:hypothetical protein SDC9_70666 [bioreactor metagenome]|uniref:Uncharacterized protein n=1 Tax=bioreactor metagenome TaxID=1076179 RepID=A0A644Y6J9_9ZZZZ